MPVMLSPDQIAFPSLHYASAEGLLAIGGDLSLPRLLCAYRNGIFPWYDETTPILWWSPPQRCVLLPEDFHLPRSLRRVVRSGCFELSLDRDFAAVIRNCALTPRPEQGGTWLTRAMIDGYTALHKAGIAHSVEARQDGELVGGLYGVSLGGVFFGESMFFHRREASKVCLVWLVELLRYWGFTLIDCQQTTRNLLRFGARAMPRSAFLDRLRRGISLTPPVDVWVMPEGFFPACI